MPLDTFGKFVVDQSPRQLIRFFRRKLLGIKPIEQFDQKHPCVFVLSTGRAGTETLAALFSLANNVISHHEPQPIMYSLSKAAYKYEGESFASGILKDAVWAMKAELIKYSLGFGAGYVETSPQNTFLAKSIIEAIPSATFIHVVRDPRNVIRSGMRRKWYDGHPNDSTRITPLPDSPHFSMWDHYNLFQKNIWLWIETNRWVLEFAAQLTPDKILTVRSEDVFSMKQKTVQDLYTFIGAEVPPSSKISRLLGKKMNAQKTGEFPSWESWLPEQKKTLIDMASEMAARFGYEL